MAKKITLGLFAVALIGIPLVESGNPILGFVLIWIGTVGFIVHVGSKAMLEYIPPLHWYTMLITGTTITWSLAFLPLIWFKPLWSGIIMVANIFLATYLLTKLVFSSDVPNPR